ncbi:MAG: biotin/lipoyl-binding protein, partial [Clostridiales bacterium]|nr:biotin/lipoyl-binding protein [Clostridiales bacterium]
MNKTGKRILSVALALLLVVGCAAGGVYAWNHRSREAVNVYAVSDFAMTNYWGDSTTSDGLVETEGLQSVYLSDTQTVKEVLVSEGDYVQEGDPLLTYDTTLTELDLQKKDIAVQQLELELADAQKELSTVKSYKPNTYIPGSVTVTVIPGTDPVEEPGWEDDGTLTLISGTGTYDDPFVYQWSSTDSFSDALLYQAMRGLDECYVEFIVTGTGSPLNTENQRDSDTLGDSDNPNTPDDPTEPTEPTEPTAPTDTKEPPHPTEPTGR